MSPVGENTGNLEILTSCKFLDPKEQGYCNICCEFSSYFSLKLNVSAKSVSHATQPQFTEIGIRKICGWTGKTQAAFLYDKYAVETLSFRM